MVDQSKKYERVFVNDDDNGVKYYTIIYKTIRDYLNNYAGYNAQQYETYKNDFEMLCNREEYYSQEAAQGFYQDVLHKQDITIDNTDNFKMLQLACATYGEYIVKKDEVVHHMEGELGGETTYYMMHEPLRSFDDFEGSVREFCQLKNNLSGLYITPIFQNNKFYLGFVNIENGQFNKDDMKIYVPKDQESTTKTAKSCMEAMEDIFKHIDVSQANFYQSNFCKFSDFQKENTRRDSSEDDVVIIESDSSYSDESQDMPHTQHDVPNYDNTQYNRFEFDNSPFNTPPPQFGNFPPISNMPPYHQGPQNMPPYHQGPQNMPSYGYSQNPVGHDLSNGSPSSFIHNTSNRENSFSPNTHGTSDLHSNASGAGFQAVSSDDEYRIVRELLAVQSEHYKGYKPIINQGIDATLLKENKNIKFDEIIKYYENDRRNLELNDVKILQTLYGLEQGASFSVDSNGNTYMTKKNDSKEDICVCTTPVLYNDGRFGQILQNFLKTHQNFSGIFAVTCNYAAEDELYSTEDGWSLTTCEIQNGQITNVYTPNFFDENRRSLGAMYCLKYLLSKNSYSEYKRERAPQEDYLNKARSIINTVNQSIEGRRRMQRTPGFNPSQFNIPLTPLHGNLPPMPNDLPYQPYQQNMPPHHQGPRNPDRYDPNFDLHGMPNDMPQFYVCNGFDSDLYEEDLRNGNTKEIESYFFRSCCRNVSAYDLPRDYQPLELLYYSCISQHGEHEPGKDDPVEEQKAFETSWDNFKKDGRSFAKRLEDLENGHMLNSHDIKLLQLYYADEVKKNTRNQVIYHYDSLEHRNRDDFLIQCSSLITEIRKNGDELPYFMMPVMYGGLNTNTKQFTNIEAMAKYLPGRLVRDGVYLIPTHGGQHWELTCAKKQGNSLEYFVTGIQARDNNCGVNTTRAMQYVIEHGYDMAKTSFRPRHTIVKFFGGEGAVFENEFYGIHNEELPSPHYFNRDMSPSDYHKNTHFSTYVPQHPIFRGTTEHSYFDTFYNFLAHNTWLNDYFSFENAELNEIFKKYKGKEVDFGVDFINKFNKVCNSNGGKIALQYNDDQGRQIKETIDLGQIELHAKSYNYNELNTKEEKKLTRFLFQCKIAEMINLAQNRYDSEQKPYIQLNEIFADGEGCKVQIGQISIDFIITQSKEDFSKMARDILCTNTNVKTIRDTLSRNYFQDDLTISVDGIQGITSASEEKDIRKMYFDIAFNKKPFTCTVLGKQRRFDFLLFKEMAVDNVVELFELAHLVTGFDALSADIEKKHGEIIYKIGEKELNKEEFLLALYHQKLALYNQELCTMSYYVNGQERRIRYNTRTGWQNAIETMQEDAKADGLEAYKQQIRSSTILQQIKTDNGGKFGGNGNFSCEIVLANDDYTNKNLSTILPNCLEEDGSVNFKFKVHGREYILEPREWSHGQSAGELSKIYEQQIASCYIASSIFNSDVDKIKIGKEEIGIDKTNGSNNYGTVQQRLHTALQNKQDIELFIGEKQSTIFTKQNVIKNTDNALTEVRLGAKEVQIRVDAFKNALLTRYDDDLQCFIEESGNKFYFIDENGVNCTKDIHDKGRDLKAQDLRNCKIREQQFDKDASYDIDFYDNVLSGRIGIIKKDIEYAYKRFFLLHDLDDYRSKGQEDNTGSEYTYKFLKDGIEQTKHDDDTKTQLIYKHKSGEEITYTLPSFNDDGYDDMYDNDRYAEIIVDFKLAIQDVQVFNDMDIDQMDGNNKVYIKVNGEQKDDCYIEGLETDQELDTLQKKFDFLTTDNPLSNYQPIKLHYKGGDYICSHKFQDNGDQYITRDNFKQNFNNFATILDMQERGFIQVQYSDGTPYNNQDLYKAICYKKNVGREENKTVQIVYGDKKIDLKPDEGYKAISEQLRDLKKQQEQDVEEVKKALNEAGLELKTVTSNHQLYIRDQTSKQSYFFRIKDGDYLVTNGKENLYAKLLNTRENVKILKKIGKGQTKRALPIITEDVLTTNNVSNFKKCLNAIVQNELNDTLAKYTTNVKEVDRTFGFEDAPDAFDVKEHTITLCGNQTIKYNNEDVKSIRDAQKKVERAPHPLLAQGISGSFLENSLIVDDTGYVKIKPKHCNEEYQLFTRQGGRDQPVQDDAFKGKNTKEILDTICQNYSIDSDTQIYAKNEDDIATVAIPLYASTARAGDKGGFFDSFYQSFEKLELYNRLKKIRADGNESKMEIRHDDYGYTTLINSVNQLTNIFKSQDIVSVKCQYGESNKEFLCPLLRTNYDNPLDDNTFNNVDQYIENTINSKPSRDAEEVLSQIKYDAGTHKTTINGREIYFYKVGNNGRGRVVRIEPVEDSGKRGYLDYKKLHKNVKSFKNTEKLKALYTASDGSHILSDNIDFEDDESLKNFVNKATFFDEFVKLNRDEGIDYTIKEESGGVGRDRDIIFDSNTRTMYDRMSDKYKKYKITMKKDGDSEEIEVQFDTKDHILEAIDNLRNTAEDLLNPIGLDMLNTFDSSKKKKHKKRKKTKDDSADIEDTTVIKDEEIEESKKEKKKKEEKYDPFEDMENNPELRKLVESFIEKSDPDMSAVIRQDGMMKLIQSDSIIEDFRKSAKYDKDYLTNSSNAMDTMEDIQKLDDILHKEGDFYDKCDYYQSLDIKLANKNVHELQLLAVAEYVNRNENQEAKYFTSDKLNGPNYVYLEDKKLLISLSPEGYKDDFVGENKELEELIKNNSVTKLSAKKKDGDWVLDCYLNKDKDHLIVDPRTDNRQQDNTSSGVWAARSTSEIIELGIENFKFLNAYRKTVQEYPDFLRNEEPSDLNRIKLSFRKFNHLKKEKQTAETFAKILDEVEDKSSVEVIQELKYTVMDKKNTGKSKQDKEKEEKEEAERKAMHNLEIDKKIEQITNKEKRNTFFGFSFSGSAMLAMGIGGPLGIVTGLTVCAALIFTRQMILRRKNKMKATQDVKEKYVENKPLLEAQPSLGNEVCNNKFRKEFADIGTKNLDLNTNSTIIDNSKPKSKEKVHD